jgi:hypothetical protein
VLLLVVLVLVMVLVVLVLVVLMVLMLAQTLLPILSSVMIVLSHIRRRRLTKQVLTVRVRPRVPLP